MDKTHRAICLGLALGLGLAWSDTVEAADPKIKGYDFLPEAKWGELKNKDVGKKYYVEGRWLEFYRPGISFYKRNDMRKFLIIPGTPDDPLYEQVVKGEDSLGNKLQKKESMVRVFGVGQRQAGRIVLRVDRVDKLPDEHTIFLAKLDAAGDDLDELLELGRECAARAKLMEDKKLEAVADRITQQELKSRVAQVKGEDFQGLMKLGERYEKELEDLPAAIMIYGKVVEDPRAPKAIKRAALKWLYDREAMRMRVENKSGKEEGRWVTYSEFKHMEGFVFRRARPKAASEWARKDRWIRKEWAELEDARALEMNIRRGKVVAVRTNLHQHAKAATDGRVERGQNFVEVNRAVGSPKLVNHWKGVLEGKAVIWSQWVLETGGRIYFVDGEVISTKTAGEDWPSSEWVK